jgi:hypothetical protein
MQKLIHAHAIEDLLVIAMKHLPEFAYNAEFAKNIDLALNTFTPDERLTFYREIDPEMMCMYS